MDYIYQILSAILIGTSVGSLLGRRNNVLLIGALIAVALAIATIITKAWLPLTVGAIVLFIAHAMQRDKTMAA